MSSWQTANHTYHPVLYNEGVEYVLRQLLLARNIVHDVLSMPQFGLAGRIERAHVPVAGLYPGSERITGSGLVLVMSTRWPLEIVHPFGCQHFDGGYYPEAPEIPARAGDVRAELARRGLQLDDIARSDVPQWYPRVALDSCAFYAISRICRAEGQQVTLDAPWWANDVWPSDIAGHYKRAMTELNIAA